MRISFVTPEFVTEPTFCGGLANYLGRVTRALCDRGHDVHVFTKSDNRHEPLVDHFGVKVHRVVPLWDSRMIFDHVDPFVPRQHYDGYQDVKAAWCLRRRWSNVNREADFDIVQAANVGACGLFFRRESRVPVVTRLSSYRPLWDRSSGVEITNGLKRRWKLERMAIEGSKFHYAPSAFVAQETMSNYRVGQVDVIESPFFQEVPLRDGSVYNALLAGKQYLLFFGKHTRMKGTHLLGDALTPVLDNHPSVHCVFVGADTQLAPGGGSMREYVRSRNGKHLDRFHFLESLKHAQLYPIVENCLSVLIPSLADNLPNTCLEAMGLGKVVVAATGSCFEQLIQPGESGFLAENNCSSSLGEMIERAVKLSPEARTEIGMNAKCGIARLHPDHAVPKLLEYYESVIERFGERGKLCKETSKNYALATS